MSFRVISDFQQVETIAQGRGIRELKRLVRAYGIGNWFKKKGLTTIIFDDGLTFYAEVHWHEANGIGKRDLKIKKLIRRP